MANGTALALPLHFHHEDQIAFILEGTRHFVLAHQRISLTKGHALLIPAGVPHFSKDDTAHGSTETLGLNLYIDAGSCTERADISQLLHDMTGIRPHNVHSLTAVLPLFPSNEHLLTHSVTTLAHQSGMSREAFSRRFHRLYGLSPRDFRLLGKLNHVKTLLRHGKKGPDVALEAGFADQSHMGRLFHRTFGTTPARYRIGNIS